MVQGIRAADTSKTWRFCSTPGCRRARSPSSNAKRWKRRSSSPRPSASETCRHPGRRLLLGWTGSSPGVRQGPASVKLLHEFLEQLATLRSSTEGGLSALLDVVPPSTIRESYLIVVSTRPINLLEEAERSSRLSGPALRGLLSRVLLLDASKGDLTDLIQFGKDGSTANSRRGLGIGIERSARDQAEQSLPAPSDESIRAKEVDSSSNGRKVFS